MKNEFKIPFKISAVGLMEFDIDYRASFNEFKNRNRRRAGYLVYTIPEAGAEFYQHKYYRGYLVEPFAAVSYNGNIEAAHWYLKEKFLFVACNNPDEVPKRVRSRAKEYYERFLNKKTGEIITMMIGYTPSTGDLTRKEFREYIQKVEVFLNDKVTVTEEGLLWRIRAMGAPDDPALLFVPEKAGDTAAS